MWYLSIYLFKKILKYHCCIIQDGFKLLFIYFICIGVVGAYMSMYHIHVTVLVERRGH